MKDIWERSSKILNDFITLAQKVPNTNEPHGVKTAHKEANVCSAQCVNKEFLYRLRGRGPLTTSEDYRSAFSVKLQRQVYVSFGTTCREEERVARRYSAAPARCAYFPTPGGAYSPKNDGRWETVSRNTFVFTDLSGGSGVNSFSSRRDMVPRYEEQQAGSQVESRQRWEEPGTLFFPWSDGWRARSSPCHCSPTGGKFYTCVRKQDNELFWFWGMNFIYLLLRQGLFSTTEVVEGYNIIS